MKRWMSVLCFLLSGLLPAQPVPEISYQSVPDFLKLPKDTYFGEVAGVAVNSKGHVLSSRAGELAAPLTGAPPPKLLEFDVDANFIREIACPSETELYVAELLNWRVQKLILERRACDGRH
jgi:hypothetical protein